MNTKLLYSLFLLLTAATLARAQGTAFTYQGRLNLDGAPVNGKRHAEYLLDRATAEEA